MVSLVYENDDSIFLLLLLSLSAKEVSHVAIEYVRNILPEPTRLAGDGAKALKLTKNEVRLAATPQPHSTAQVRIAMTLVPGTQQVLGECIFCKKWTG